MNGQNKMSLTNDEKESTLYNHHLLPSPGVNSEDIVSHCTEIRKERSNIQYDIDGRFNESKPPDVPAKAEDSISSD